MQHDQPTTDGDSSFPFPQPELDDSDPRSSRHLEVVRSASRVRVNLRVLESLLRHTLRQEGLRHGQLTLALLDPQEMREANLQFHDADEPTDHLGFQYDAPDGEVSGDIFICPEVCVEQAADFAETPRREIARVAVHGVLHLAGWNDDTPARRRRMRAREDAVLASALELPSVARWMEGGKHGR